MRILSITAGAAGMYCGSCFRDNALAVELLARGHDVTLLPVYTPTRTDEENVSRDDVLFGGISVYLQQYSSLFRKLPSFVDRLWDAPRVIAAFAGRAVAVDARLLGNLTVSMLQGERGILSKEFEKLIDWTKGEPTPDVVNLPNSLLISMAAPLKQALQRPVCCTLQGEELFLDGLTPAFREQALSLIREQVQHVDRFIAVSDYCAEFMMKLLKIPEDRMTVVPLGISMAGYTRRDPSSNVGAGSVGVGTGVSAPDSLANVGAGFGRPDPTATFRIGYFARIAPEKGLHVLAEAYIRFRRRTAGAKAALEVAGYMAPNHHGYLDDTRRGLEHDGLAHEFTYRGAIDRAGKLAFLRGLDVLSVPATYDEPKGMFLLEAMAAGVPVVQPRRGAFIEVVEKTGGGLLVAPGDPDALADGLYALWSDQAQRARLAQAAYDGVRAHYTIEQSASRLLDVYGSIATPQPSRGAA